MHDSIITFDSEAVTLFLNCAKSHREFAELALCEEARLHHVTWAERYEMWVQACGQEKIDYSRITRDIAMGR